MLTTGIPFDPTAWAAFTFGGVQLGDQRRTRRAVQLAAALMRNPSASLPHQLRAPKDLKAAYRLLAEPDVTHAKLLAPHVQHTRGVAGGADVVLLVQDTTTLNYTHHSTTTGLGPIAPATGQGFFLHTALAVIPQPRQVLGIAYQEPFVRQPAPPHETRTQRRQRPRESQVWRRAATGIGPPPPGATWVHVGDAASDIFELLAACQRQRADFLIRAAQDRRVQLPDGTCDHLFSLARALPAQATRPLALPARPARPARTALLSIAWRPLCLLAPRKGPRQPPVQGWVIRVWEATPPAGVEALEWVLLTSVPTTTLAAAWERADWYTCRWLDEDYHQCLKTGCQIEQRPLQTQAGLARLLGLLAPVAVQLLQLRELARLDPECPAQEVVPREVVQVVAALRAVPVATLTVGACWQEVARQGGYLGRKGDGPPGWKTLWRGWLYIQTLLEGVHLAPRLPRDEYG